MSRATWKISWSIVLLVREVQQGAGHDVFGLFTIEGVVAV